MAQVSGTAGIRALAVAVSNRAAAGVYEDRSGPVLADLLRSARCSVVDGPVVVPDGEPVEVILRDAVAALALIDMVKAIDPAAVITDVRVEWKEGGKTGPWRRTQ